MIDHDWNGRPADADRSGYHWLERTNNHGRACAPQLVIAYWEVDRFGSPSWWAKPFMLGSWRIADVAREWRYLGPVQPWA